MRTVVTSPVRGVRSRIGLAALILVLEALGVGSLPHPWFHPQQIMAMPIAAGAAFLLIAWHNRRFTEVDFGPVRWLFASLHALALAGLGALTYMLLSAPGLSALFVLLWYLTIAALIVTLTMALFPLQPLGRSLGSLRWGWLFIALAAGAAMSARWIMRWLWNAPNSHIGHALQAATFASVKALLGCSYAKVVTQPGNMVLGTPKFHVQIAGECSGIEGLALVLLFTIGWLVWTRRELRLARAALLIPVALVCSWALNAVRIAALIAIGDAGHSETAVNGFHSEAGWILFNIVAIAFVLAMQRLAWLRKDDHAPVPRTGTKRNEASPYLLPFLAVLATAMLTRAVSAGFDWLYPLRLVVGGAMLLYFRGEYRRLDWRFSWLGLTAGVIVFGVWLAVDHMQPVSVSLLAGDLLALPVWQRTLWIAARILAAVITVPLTEELAFRGYLARRIVSADVESISFARITAISIAGSSLVFGLMHGRLWVAGIIAGVLFAVVAKMRNRLGEAVAAHATANLLIAIWVLARGNYRLW